MDVVGLCFADLASPIAQTRVSLKTKTQQLSATPKLSFFMHASAKPAAPLHHLGTKHTHLAQCFAILCFLRVRWWPISLRNGVYINLADAEVTLLLTPLPVNRIYQH